MQQEEEEAPLSPEGQVTCANCGAAFSNDEPRCPYCSALNPEGAEAAYMDELENIRNDTDDLDDDVQHELEANLNRNAKRVVLVALIAVAAIIATFAIVNCTAKMEERQEIQEYQARESFREQYFAEFDRLYEAGDDDALSEYVWSLMDDPGFDGLFSWQHADYLRVHDDWEALKSIEPDLRQGSVGIDDRTWATSVAIRLAYPSVDGQSKADTLSAEEELRAAPYRAYAWQFLRDTLNMNQEEASYFVDKCTDERGNILEDELKRNLELRLNGLGSS